MRLDFGQIVNKKPLKTVLFLFIVIVIVLFSMASAKYSGHWYIYLLFSIISNLMLYFGFRSRAIFFDTFLGVFFWLGFWLKLTIRVAFSDELFHEAVGYFDGSGIAFDRALLVTSCGMLGFLLVSYLRGKFFFNYPRKIDEVSQKGLFEFYKRYRKLIWVIFVALFFFVGITNAYLGVYQRGSITRTILPFGLNGVYKWLLLFGLASISALILRFEFEISKKTSWVVMLLSLLESFVSNVSLLSRGMILNSGALLYGVFTSLKTYSFRSSIRFFLVTGLIFGMLFMGSVYAVNYFRSSIYLDADADLSETHAMTTPLFIDRWVGMEGVMAVSSYPKLGWGLWESALKETYNEKETSFYDNYFIESAYVNTDKSKHHFISLPGVIAFFFYPGSFYFLFFSMFFLGGFASIIEYATYRMGGMNIILCSLFAQVVAFRFASFGYVPRQSYLLFGTVFLNLIIIYLTNRLLAVYYKKKFNKNS